MRGQLFLFSLLFVLLNSACNESVVHNSESDIFGRILLKLETQNIPADVKEITATASRSGFNDVVKSLTITNQPVLELLIDDLPIGNWQISLEAFNEEGEKIYEGQTGVEIIENTTVLAEIDLVRTGNTGSVLIVVKWPGQSRFIDYNNNPVLMRATDSWDRYGVYEPIVVKDDDYYHMWFTAYERGDVSYIMYAKSIDGINWFRPTFTPVLIPGITGNWDSESVAVGPVIKVDGMFLMYYHGRSSRVGPWHIGLATSVNGMVWEKYNNPVLIGESGSRNQKLSVSHVEIINNKYYMYYNSKSDYESYSIYLAVSDNGTTWNKYSSYPILSATHSWEQQGIYWPTVYKEKNLFKMIYMNNSADGFGIASSADGINWSKDYPEPIFSLQDTHNNWDLILYPHVIIDENHLVLFYSGYIGRSNEKFICRASKDLD